MLFIALKRKCGLSCMRSAASLACTSCTWSCAAVVSFSRNCWY
jgi:hypothetical protein